MNAFFKTFFVCLVLTFSFLCYKYFSADGVRNDLALSKNNPIFGIHEEVDSKFPQDDYDVVPQEQEVLPPVEEEIQKPIEKKYTHSCYFYSNNGELIKMNRELKAEPSTKSAILLLLKGPTIKESKKGIYSEIPANVDLISLDSAGNTIIVNLSPNFGKGGGTQSIDNRVKQLSKTVKLYEPKKKVYLYIDGKEVEYLGGEGVYIKQPLE